MKKAILAVTMLASFATICAQETKKVDSSKASEMKKEVAKPIESSVKQVPVVTKKAEEHKMEAEKKAKMIAKDPKRNETDDAIPKMPQ